MKNGLKITPAGEVSVIDFTKPDEPDTSDATEQVCTVCGDKCQPDDSQCACGGTITDVPA